MARVQVPARTRTTKYNKVWVKDWNQIPKSPNIPISDYMKRLVKYYPKTARSLKPLSQLFNEIGPVVRNKAFEQSYKGIYKQIIRKYKSDLFRHTQAYNDPMNPLFDRSLKSLQSLSINTSQRKFFVPISDSTLKKIFTHNRNIKMIKISDQEWCSDYLVKCLKYLKSLQELEITDLPFLPVEEYRHILSSKSLKTKLERVAITGAIDPTSDLANNKDYLVKFLDYLISLPSLKQLKFDGDVSKESDVNNIPFSKLKEKGIQYDLRVCHSAGDIVFSKENAESLNELDMLGINLKKIWDRPWIGNSICIRESLQIQAITRNMLFITHFPSQHTDLTHLFHTCRNIKTLDLILPRLDHQDINFTGLRDLCNLRNLFLYLEDLDGYEGFFENLTMCAQHNAIEQLALRFPSQRPADAYSVVLSPFLNICIETLAKFVLELSNNSFNVDYIYKALENSSCLKILVLSLKPSTISDEYIENFAEYHFAQIEKLLRVRHSLKEFELRMSVPCGDAAIDLTHAKNLENLCLEVVNQNGYLGVLHGCFSLQNLKNLELYCEHILGLSVWNFFNKGLRKLEKLETLKLMLLDKNNIDLKNDCVKTMRQNPNLKLIAVGISYTFSTVFVLSRNGYWEDLDQFYWRKNDNYYMPCLVNYDIHHYEREL